MIGQIICKINGINKKISELIVLKIKLKIKVLVLLTEQLYL